MNWVKAMLLMVVLGAILYGVNLVLNKSAPPEAPATDGAWSTETTLGTRAAPPPAAATPPGYGQPGYTPPGYGPATASQQPVAPPAYGSGTYPPATSAVNPAANPATAPAAGYAQNGGYPANPPTAAPTGYQPAAPAVVGGDESHSGIPATPVGLATSSGGMPASPATAGRAGVAPPFASVMESVMTTLREGRLAEGLRQATAMYDDPKLSAEETKQLNDLLGRLAGTVVYSRQHLLMPPYEVKPGDRLETIAAKYEVPAALLAKINGIADPDHPPLGQKLKVLRGPFMALVSMNRRDVTLLVQQCYAGRFVLSGVGKGAAALSGDFKVDRKELELGVSAWSVGTPPPPVRDWIEFSGGRHGAFGLCAASDASLAYFTGALALSPRDAEDLFDILSVGSTVAVR